MLYSVGERTPPGNASFKLTLYGCVVSVCCVGFASIDVVCYELNDCAWNIGLWQRCCLPSKTYGRNWATPIFRSFYRTASSTTGGWICWNIVMCLYIYIYHSEHYSLRFGP